MLGGTEVMVTIARESGIELHTHTHTHTKHTSISMALLRSYCIRLHMIILKITAIAKSKVIL